MGRQEGAGVRKMRGSAAASVSFENWGALAAFVGGFAPVPVPVPANDAGFVLQLDGTTHRVINADVFEGLALLEDESVDCVVTSPPYWGLRDYGTGVWRGGRSSCDHVSHEIRTGLGMAALGEKYRGGGHKASAPKFIQFKNSCGKCGAVRSDGQIGQEATLQEHIDVLVRVFQEVRRVLKKDGTLWLNCGDAYAGGGRGPGAEGAKQGTNVGALLPRKKTAQGFRDKDLMLMPARLAIALQEDGWYVRSEIIWHKPNPMPESVRDRPTNAHEKLFLLTKSPRYVFDVDAVKEPAVVGYRGSSFTKGKTLEAREAQNKVGRKERVETGERNLRNVWTVATSPYKGAHFATFPPKLVEPCIKAGCREGGIVLDVFAGSGTVAKVAADLGRNSIGIELNPAYCGLIRGRLDRRTDC